MSVEVILQHHPLCPRDQFWDAGAWECSCTCPRFWPRRVPIEKPAHHPTPQAGEEP